MSEKGQRRSAWENAPLPKQTDLKTAQALVAQGMYSSLSEAYIELSSQEIDELAALGADYRERFKPTSAWRDAPLPKW